MEREGSLPGGLGFFLLPYFAATALVGLFLWLRLELGHRVDGPALIILTIPILIGAYLGGWGVGLWATFVAVLGASYYLLPPLRDFAITSAAERWQQIILVVSGATISAICGALQRTRLRAEMSRLSAERGKSELRQSQERLQTVVANLTEGLILANMEGQLFHWNRASVEMHGFADEAEGRRRLDEFTEMFELATFEGRVLILGEWPLARILRGEPLRDFEVRIRRRDITWERVFSYGGAIVREPSGRQVAFLTITDITERHRAVEAIRWMNAELEQHVRDRTAELESANRELEAFSYSVSHDLRSPLRTVDGYAQALAEDYGAQLPSEAQRYLKTIRSGAQGMGALIDDLLEFSRLGRKTLVKRQVSMDRLVQATLEELAPQKGDRRVDVHCASLPACEGDEALLKQVWINLLSNAFKYTRRREQAAVEIGSEVIDGATVYRVRDNGTGFDMQYAGKLFGVFQRLHRAEDYEGTGVGLATVQRIIHRHGGRIWAEGAVDRGATFCFTLPNGEKHHE